MRHVKAWDGCPCSRRHHRRTQHHCTVFIFCSNDSKTYNVINLGQGRVLALAKGSRMPPTVLTQGWTLSSVPKRKLPRRQVFIANIPSQWPVGKELSSTAPVGAELCVLRGLPVRGWQGCAGRAIICRPRRLPVAPVSPSRPCHRSGLPSRLVMKKTTRASS